MILGGIARYLRTARLALGEQIKLDRFDRELLQVDQLAVTTHLSHAIRSLLGESESPGALSDRDRLYHTAPGDLTCFGIR